MSAIMISVVIVVFIMLFDWLWVHRLFGAALDRIWVIYSLICLATGRLFSDAAQSREELEWTMALAIAMYLLSGATIIIGIGKRFSRKT